MADIINRADAAALIPTEYSAEIIQGAIQQSIALSLFTRLADMGTNVREMPVLSTLPFVYFPGGDTGMKKASSVSWEKKSIVAEELAVIFPIPKNVLNDAKYDIIGQIKPLLIQSFGQAIDAAIFFGVNKPALWPDDIVTMAGAAGNTLIDTGNIYDDTLGEDGIYTLVEQDGFDVNGAISAISMKAVLRGLKDTTGRPLYDMGIPKEGGTPFILGDAPLYFARNGVWDDAKAKLIVGDMTQAVYAMRQDITYDIFDSGVIQDTDNSIKYNLIQQDMIALRAVMRLGWQVPNPINAMNADKNTRCPFAALIPS